MAYIIKERVLSEHLPRLEIFFDGPLGEYSAPGDSDMNQKWSVSTQNSNVVSPS
jgi:hypothetical protein